MRETLPSNSLNLRDGVGTEYEMKRTGHILRRELVNKKSLELASPNSPLLPTHSLIPFVFTVTSLPPFNRQSLSSEWD